MHLLIQKLLKKQGISDTNELREDERNTFDTWAKILSKEQLTTEDIKNFCINQITIIEGKWADLNIDQAKKTEFIPYHVVYKALLAAIDSPRVAREALEKQLNQLIGQ